MRAHTFLTLGLLVSLLANSAIATCPCTDICYTTSGTGTLSPSNFVCTYDSNDDVYDISIIAAGSSEKFTIHITGANGAVIRNLDVKNTGGSGTIVEINIVGDDDDLARVVNVTKDPMSSGEVWIGTTRTTAGIGDGDGGSITVDRIDSLVTDGDITATIAVVGASGETETIGSIVCDDLRGQVVAFSGDIGSILVGGEISISVKPFLQAHIAAENIGLVTAESIGSIAIWAAVGGPLGTIGRVETTTNAAVLADIAAESFVGSNGGLFLGGDFEGLVFLDSPLTKPIRIAGDLGSSSVIEIRGDGNDENALQAQIIANQGNVSGEWESGAEIILNADSGSEVVLIGPEYSNTAASLGGGAVGLAPFRLHRHNSIPDYGDEHPGSSLSGLTLDCVLSFNAAYLEFYGPVAENGEDPCVIVEYKEFDEGQYVDVSEDFVTSVDSVNTPRRVTVQYTGGEWPLGSYRITRSGSKLVCISVNETPSVAAFTHFFRLVDGCEEMLLATFDLNNDDDLTYAGDVGAWTGAPVDLTGDNSADEDDLGMLLTAINQFNE